MLDVKKLSLAATMDGLRERNFQEEKYITVYDKVDSMVALVAKSGCKAQLAHTDYSSKTFAEVLLPEHNDKIMLLYLVTLTDGTLLDVQPHDSFRQESHIYTDANSFARR
jgi:hypothetical protein